MKKKPYFTGYDRDSFFTHKPEYNKSQTTTITTQQTKEQQMALHITPPAPTKIKGLGLGSFQAVIFSVWHVGLQENEFKGVKKINDSLIIGFETDERIDEEGEYKGKRKIITKKYSISAYEKSNLMKHLKILLGDKCPTEKTFPEFDFESLIGVNCIIGIALTESGNDKLESITRIMKGMALLKPETSSIPPKWVEELKEKGKILLASQNVGFTDVNPANIGDDNLPF